MRFKKFLKAFLKFLLTLTAVIGSCALAIYGYFLWDEFKIQERMNIYQAELKAGGNLLNFIENHPDFKSIQFNRLDGTACLAIQANPEHQYDFSQDGQPGAQITADEGLRFLLNYKPVAGCQKGMIIYHRNFIWNLSIDFELLEEWTLIRKPTLSVWR